MITFHTPFPNMSAQLTFQGVTVALVTDTEGNLYYFTAPNGTHPFAIVFANGNQWSGDVVVTDNTGYIALALPFPWGALIAFGIIIGATAVVFVVVAKK